MADGFGCVSQIGCWRKHGREKKRDGKQLIFSCKPWFPFYTQLFTANALLKGQVDNANMVENSKVKCFRWKVGTIRCKCMLKICIQVIGIQCHPSIFFYIRVFKQVPFIISAYRGDCFWSVTLVCLFAYLWFFCILYFINWSVFIL